MQTIEQFWSHIEKADPLACWEWKAGVQKGGYGWLRWQGYPRLAHRVAWDIEHGTAPIGLVVCHHCDNRLCCNPTHLFLGTQDDNVQDRVFKDRSASGQRNGSAKMNWETVSLMRQIYAAGGISQKRLSSQFGISQGTLSDILLYKHWVP